MITPTASSASISSCRWSKLRLLGQLTEFFHGRLPVDTLGSAVTADELLGDRREAALALIDAVCVRAGAGSTARWTRRLPITPPATRTRRWSPSAAT